MMDFEPDDGARFLVMRTGPNVPERILFTPEIDGLRDHYYGTVEAFDKDHLVLRAEVSWDTYNRASVERVTDGNGLTIKPSARWKGIILDVTGAFYCDERREMTEKVRRWQSSHATV